MVLGSRSFIQNTYIFLVLISGEQLHVSVERRLMGLRMNLTLMLFILGFSVIASLSVYGLSVGEEKISATVIFKPETLNLKERGLITAFIELPSSYDVNKINVSTVSIERVVPASWGRVENGRLMVKFDASETIDFIWTSKLLHMAIIPPQANRYIELKVVGELTDGSPFEGVDSIKVINP